MSNYDDLYEDLPEETTSDYIAKIESQLNIVQKKYDDSQKLIKELSAEKHHNLKRIAELEKKVEDLEKNISSLYKTAVVEAKRKDNLLNELRAEADDLAFRRRENYRDRFANCNRDRFRDHKNGQDRYRNRDTSPAEEKHRFRSYERVEGGTYSRRQTERNHKYDDRRRIEIKHDKRTSSEKNNYRDIELHDQEKHQKSRTSLEVKDRNSAEQHSWLRNDQEYLENSDKTSNKFLRKTPNENQDENKRSSLEQHSRHRNDQEYLENSDKTWNKFLRKIPNENQDENKRSGLEQHSRHRNDQESLENSDKIADKFLRKTPNENQDENKRSSSDQSDFRKSLENSDKTANTFLRKTPNENQDENKRSSSDQSDFRKNEPHDHKLRTLHRKSNPSKCINSSTNDSSKPTEIKSSDDTPNPPSVVESSSNTKTNPPKATEVILKNTTKPINVSKNSSMKNDPRKLPGVKTNRSIEPLSKIKSYLNAENRPEPLQKLINSTNIAKRDHHIMPANDLIEEILGQRNSAEHHSTHRKDPEVKNNHSTEPLNGIKSELRAKNGPEPLQMLNNSANIAKKDHHKTPAENLNEGILGQRNSAEHHSRHRNDPEVKTDHSAQPLNRVKSSLSTENRPQILSNSANIAKEDHHKTPANNPIEEILGQRNPAEHHSRHRNDPEVKTDNSIKPLNGIKSHLSAESRPEALQILNNSANIAKKDHHKTPAKNLIEEILGQKNGYSLHCEAALLSMKKQSWKLITPLKDTPDHLKEKFSQIESNKINAKIPMINEQRMLSPYKNVGRVEIVSRRADEVESSKSTNSEVTADCSVTVSEDVEHGVFSRKGRKRPRVQKIVIGVKKVAVSS